jgi:hypothetical protein
VRTPAALGVAFAAALAIIPAAICCIPPPKPAAKPVTTQQVYDELVDSGCMAPDPVGGVDFLAAERTLPEHAAWIECLYDGGSISQCKPCAAAGAKQ